MLRLFTYTQAFAAQKWYVLRDREEGQTMAEYGVVLAVITLGIIVALTTLSETVRDKIEEVYGVIAGGGSSSTTP